MGMGDGNMTEVTARLLSLSLSFCRLSSRCLIEAPKTAKKHGRGWEGEHSTKTTVRRMW